MRLAASLLTQGMNLTIPTGPRPQVLRELCGPDFMLLSGEDSNAFEFTLLGGDGVISVTSNVAPAQQVHALATCCPAWAQRLLPVSASLRSVMF